MNKLHDYRLIGLEVEVAFDRKSELSPKSYDFREAHIAEFRATKTQVAQPEKAIRFVRIAFGKEPGRASVRGEQLDHWRVVTLVGERVGEQPDAILDGEEVFLSHEGLPLPRLTEFARCENASCVIASCSFRR